MGKLSNEINAATGDVAQEEWLRDKSEHPLYVYADQSQREHRALPGDH